MPSRVEPSRNKRPIESIATSGSPAERLASGDSVDSSGPGGARIPAAPSIYIMYKYKCRAGCLSDRVEAIE